MRCLPNRGRSKVLGDDAGGHGLTADADVHRVVTAPVVEIAVAPCGPERGHADVAAHTGDALGPRGRSRHGDCHHPSRHYRSKLCALHTFASSLYTILRACRKYRRSVEMVPRAPGARAAGRDPTGVLAIYPRTLSWRRKGTKRPSSGTKSGARRSRSTDSLLARAHLDPSGDLYAVRIVKRVREGVALLQGNIPGMVVVDVRSRYGLRNLTSITPVAVFQSIRKRLRKTPFAARRRRIGSGCV